MTFDDAVTQHAHVRRYPAVHCVAGSDIRGWQQTSGAIGLSDSADQLQLDVCRALHLWPSEVSLECGEGIASVRALIRQALRRQRGLAISGHWSYELSVHARLLDLYRRTGHMPAAQGHEPGCCLND